MGFDDDFSLSFAGVALVAYTIVADDPELYRDAICLILSSAYALPGKFFKSLSGLPVEALTPTFGLVSAYALF